LPNVGTVLRRVGDDRFRHRARGSFRDVGPCESDLLRAVAGHAFDEVSGFAIDLGEGAVVAQSTVREGGVVPELLLGGGDEVLQRQGAVGVGAVGEGVEDVGSPELVRRGRGDAAGAAVTWRLAVAPWWVRGSHRWWCIPGIRTARGALGGC